MKNYFKFNLTGQKLFPVWILFLVLIAGTTVAIYFKAKDIQHDDPSAYIFIVPAIFFVYSILFIVSFYVSKMVIEGVEFKEKSFVFSGEIVKFIGVFLLGLLLSIITIGIYSPWFIRNIMKFFVNNTSHDENPFEFKGKGGELFVIILVTYLIPIVFIALLSTISSMFNHMHQSTLANGIIQVITMFVMIPYTYFVYKWMVNVKYKSYTIAWQTDAWDSFGTILIQYLLTVITIGIYYPLAMLKLYKYFAEKTIATNDIGSKKFGYDLEAGSDFLYLWGQVLLIIVTLGIYYPWAFCKISERVIGKTYTEEI
jgi:uncharacterized membrane protein YjgN (DUF898 family)